MLDMTGGIIVTGENINVIATLLGILLCGNLYFINQLVRKINRLDETVTATLPVYSEQILTIKNEIAVLKNAMADADKGVKSELQTLTNNFKEVSDLKARVAVLDFAYSQLMERQHVPST